MAVPAKRSSRAYVLMGTVLCMFALGTIYTWSLFNQPLSEKFHWKVEDVAFTFAITSIALSTASLASGKLEELFGVRKVATCCGIVLGIGLLLASRATSLGMLYLTAGLMVGAADGIAYMMILSNCIRWFPDKKGVISGIAAGAFGLGSLLFKYANLSFITHLGTSQAFIFWGITIIVLMPIGASVLRRAPEPVKGSPEGATASQHTHACDYNWREMLRLKEFWMLLLVFFCCCMSGLFLISVASDLAIEWGKLDLAMAASTVTAVAISNTLGRLVLGKLSDMVLRIRIVSVICVGIFIGATLLCLHEQSKIQFFFSVSLIGFCFGGTVAVFPALIGDFFGLTNMTKNYSVIYQGFGIGAVVGSFISVWLGGFLNTLILISFLSLVSLVITLVIRRPNKHVSCVSK